MNTLSVSISYVKHIITCKKKFYYKHWLFVFVSSFDFILKILSFLCSRNRESKTCYYQITYPNSSYNLNILYVIAYTTYSLIPIVLLLV